MQVIQLLVFMFLDILFTSSSFSFFFFWFPLANWITYCRFKGETQPGLVACENAAKRLISLGLDFTPVEETIREAVESLKAQGHLG